MSSASHLMDTYQRLPVIFCRGAGARLWDQAGREYIDGMAGIAVNTLGHAHPKFQAALAQHLSNAPLHVSNLYRITQQEELAERLCHLSQMSRAFFCNSGCEANEAALKLALLHGRHQGHQRSRILVMEQAFHGRTLATLAASDISGPAQEGFDLLNDPFVRIALNDSKAAQQAFCEHEIAAVLLEPLQGEGGVRQTNLHYLETLRSLCDQHQALLIFDEVQCGVARTGKWFCFQHSTVLPDVLTLAKGLGAGIPIGCCLARDHAAQLFQPGTHGTTFGGNPFSCCAALTTLDIIEAENLVENSRVRGAGIKSALQTYLKSSALSSVESVVGEGLMLGVQCRQPYPEAIPKALSVGLLLGLARQKTVRILPPLILDSADTEQLVERLIQVISSAPTH